jgi:protein SCO1/2
MKTCSDHTRERVSVRLFGVVLIMIGVGGIGCSTPSKAPTSYPVRGEVVGIERSQGRLIVAHDEIPGFMKAMTMPFHVADTSMLHVLAVGDSLRATLVVDAAGPHLDSIVVVRHAAR